MNKLFENLAKTTENNYATKAVDGLPAGDINSYIDTGSYAFNALLSGSIFKGMPDNKITALAGEEATGKTFYALGIMKNFLDTNPDGAVFFFESEGALTKDIIESRNIDSERVFVFPVSTIQEFRFQVLSVLNQYIEGDKQPPLLMVLDSLGNLSTTKEVEDAAAGKETKDMTRTQLIRGCFRLLNLKLSKAKVPFILTNHTYKTMELYSQMVMCLSADTKILMSDYSEKEIYKIEIGDEVLSKNGTFGIVTEIFKYNNSEVFELEFEDGSIIKATKDHKFLINGQWVSVSDLVELVKDTNCINIDMEDIFISK